MKTWHKFLVVICVLFAGGTHIVSAAPIVTDSFSTTWDTSTFGGDGESLSNQIAFSLGYDGFDTCSGVLYWEEIGNDSNNGTSTLDSNCNTETITFPAEGNYRVDVSGTFPMFRTDDRHKLLTVEQWGNNVWERMDSMFDGIDNLTAVGSDAPDLSAITDLSYLFKDATSFNSAINHWNVSNIINMSGMFAGATAFNQPLNNWNVSNVTDMGSHGETSCDGSNSGMFSGATSFNQDISSWDVSEVRYFCEMFSGATAFNQPLNSWNVSKAINLSGMFADATAFNQPLNSWNVSNVTDMGYMFSGATAFNQPLNNWDVSFVQIFEGMFQYATAFNQPLGSWQLADEVCVVENEQKRFFVLDWLFPIAYACTFDWVDLNNMFNGAAAFNQSIESWDVSRVDNMSGMFSNSALSIRNYSALLTNWSASPLRPGVYLDTDAMYCATAQAARDILSNAPNNWIITDSGATTDCVDEGEPTDSENSGNTATRIGDREKNHINTTSTPLTVTKETFFEAVKKLLSYLQMNESELAQLSPEESKNVIVGLRDIIVFLLSLLPNYE